MNNEPLCPYGKSIYQNDEAVYFCAFNTAYTKLYYNQFDYVLIEDVESHYIGKIHSIFMCKKFNELKIEVQVFKLLEDHSESESNVIEVLQTVDTIEIAVNDVNISHARVMYVDSNNCKTHVREYVVDNILSYVEHSDCESDDEDGRKDKNDQYDEDDSFIASEYESDSDDSDDEDSYKDEDESSSEEEESSSEEEEEEESSSEDEDSSGSEGPDSDSEDNTNNVRPSKRTRRKMTVYFFYRYLQSPDNEVEAVPAIEPKLFDLALSYGCDPRDFECTVYKELRAYVLDKYFNGETDEKKLELDERYLKLKNYVEKSAEEKNFHIYEFVKLFY